MRIMRQQFGYWCTTVCIVHYVLNQWIIAEQISLVQISVHVHCKNKITNLRLPELHSYNCMNATQVTYCMNATNIT